MAVAIGVGMFVVSVAGGAVIAKGGKILIKSLGPVAETALAKAAKKILRKAKSRLGGKKLRNVSAADANAGFAKPPYDPSKPIVDFKADGSTQYVRVYNSGPNSSQSGQWLMKADDIQGLSPQQIKDKFDLPNLPTHITDVTPPRNTRIRTGTVNSGNFGGMGGGTQFQLRGRIHNDVFTNPRPL